MDHQPNKDNSVGPLIGIVIILLILVLGGLYFWGERLAEQREMRRVKAPSAKSARPASLEASVPASSTPEYR
ncbi:MAG TPA: hypothetical protein VD967_01095 [Candidatus Paceibacterota bacterium]|nr:hypothetical protein [Candidatus Paceibacterota bacterium]